MEQSPYARLAEYFESYSLYKQESTRFNDFIEKNHKEVLDDIDNELFENAKVRYKIKKSLATVAGPMFSFFILYKMDLYRTPLNKLYFILFFSSYIPYYYITLNWKSTHQRNLEEYFYSKYSDNELFINNDKDLNN